MTETLLEQAKKIPRRNILASTITDEEIELAIAWLKEELSLGQICSLFGRTLQRDGSSRTYKMMVWLREGYRRGRLKEIKK